MANRHLLNESHIARYYQLKDKGMTEEEIAEVITDYPISTPTLQKWKKRFGIKTNRVKKKKKLDKSHVPIYLKHKETGVKDSIIAHYMGVHLSTLAVFKRNYGLTGGKQK